MILPQCQVRASVLKQASSRPLTNTLLPFSSRFCYHGAKHSPYCNTTTLIRSTAVPTAPLRKPNFVIEENGTDSSVRLLLGSHWRNLGQLSEAMMKAVARLPGTKSVADLRMRVDALGAWRLAFSQGILPNVASLEWPRDPFKTKFAETLIKLDLLPFARRYPFITNMLIQHLLTLAQEFEQKMEELEAQKPKKEERRKKNERQKGEEGASPPEEGSQEEDERGEQQRDPQERKPAEDASEEMEMEMGKRGDEESTEDSIERSLEEVAEKLAERMEKELKEAAENLHGAEAALGDISALLEESKGTASGVWKHSGWRELASLQKVLEDCPELRQLVRALGRGGGKGPRRLAPQELERGGRPDGLVSSSLQPEEVSGLTRSGDLSRMLPCEAALLASGWAKEAAKRRAGAANADELEPESPARAARLLHRVRRAEKLLVSYDRTGWMDLPAEVTRHLEHRPAAEMGPVIICLDTSGSMQGYPELISKAVVLAVLRAARRQRRLAFLYAFSGPEDVRELELSATSADAMTRLMDFLACAFGGGTDVDRPLELSLERIRRRGGDWARADILLVTDGEIMPPSEHVIKSLHKAREELSLRVHGLILNRRNTRVSREMADVCVTDCHVFKNWSAVQSLDRILRAKNS